MKLWLLFCVLSVWLVMDMSKANSASKDADDADDDDGDGCGDCKDELFQECYKNKCRCKPGYYLSTKSKVLLCLENCTTPADTFTVYNDSMIQYNESPKINQTLDECEKSCIASRDCKSFTVKTHNGTTKCYVLPSTARTVPRKWRNITKPRWDYFQRDCLD